MANVKGRYLKVDFLNTDKLRELSSDIKQYSTAFNLGDFTSDDDIPNLRAVKALTSIVSTSVVTQTIIATLPDVYTLTAPELSAINSLNRYGNFGAFIGGVEFFDISPTYVGLPGSFSAITVQLHSDGAGNNVDNTFIQFS